MARRQKSDKKERAESMNDIDWGLTFSVVLVGLVVVFAALVVLIFFVWLMGKIFIALDKKKKKAQEEKEQDNRRQAQQAMDNQAKADQAATAAARVEEGIPPEVVAAISAAVAVTMEQSAPGVSYTIQRVQRAGTGRSAWGNAGLAAQLSPFDR